MYELKNCNFYEPENTSKKLHYQVSFVCTAIKCEEKKRKKESNI